MSQQYRYPSSSAVTVAAIGPNGSPIPPDSILIAGEDGAGDLTPLSTDNSGNLNVNVISSPTPAGAATAANQVLEIAQLTNIDTAVTALNVRTAGALVPAAFDYVALTYVPSGNGAGQVQTATYKTGGSGGSTVATLTLVYDSSNNLSTVTKS